MSETFKYLSTGDTNEILIRWAFTRENNERLPLYGEPSNSGENLNGVVHPRGNLPEKSNSFQGITFSPFLPKQGKFQSLYHLSG